MRDSTIIESLISSIQTVKGGFAPWPLEGGLVTDGRVRDALRQWEQEQRSRQVVVKAPPAHRVNAR